MSHEIRTPLTAIIGFAESLLESGQSMAERLDSIHTIIRNGRHLQALISDILDISKVEAGRLTVEQVPTDLFDLLKEVEATASSQASTKGLEFTINHMLPLPRTLFTDPTRLRQILLNLCNNAVKFTETGSVRVIVSCDVAAHQLIVSVFDSGIGLSSGQRDNLFKPFVQADVSTTRRFGGTRLGLHISKRLAELLGGTVRVESLPGSGSLFVAVVDTGPLEEVKWVRSAEEIPTSFSPMARVIRPRRLTGSVLLAEDSPDNQRLISLYLRRTGAKVALAEDGRQAVEQALEGDFDLVLMDMQMPVLDGPDATALLRATGFGRPVIALTANASTEDRERCQAAGCNDFLTKPVDWEQFYRVLATYLPEASPGDVELPSASGLAELADDPEYQAMVKRFMKDCPERIAELGHAVDQQNWEEVRRLAHRIKGVAGGLGMPELGGLAGDMEFQAIRRAGSEVAALLESMESWCRLS